jgi:membrane fusion protein (multidrug efflux system)
VRQGDVLAEFDPTAQLQAERDTEARFDDLKHQIEQKIAEQRSNAAGRASDLQQAEGDLEKARLEIKKGPILSTIDDQKNAAKLEDAQQHVASLKRSNRFHDVAEAAELRVLELQRDRQQVALDRARGNMQKLIVRAPLGGMVALDNVWKNGSLGHAQEGDQLWPGSPLLRIFDPSQMEVRLTVNEPDNSILRPGMEGVVHVDAYPELSFHAVFDTAAPVASSANDSPLKTFDARFRFLTRDPHLLPDLSAAVDVETPGAAR